MGIDDPACCLSSRALLARSLQEAYAASRSRPSSRGLRREPFDVAERSFSRLAGDRLGALAATLYVNGASLRRFERRHDFKRVERELPRCSLRPARTISVDHFGRAESAQTKAPGRALYIGVAHRDAPPVGIALAEHLNVAVKVFGSGVTSEPSEP